MPNKSVFAMAIPLPQHIKPPAMGYPRKAKLQRKELIAIKIIWSVVDPGN
jgi:hypothetical protein